MQLKALALALVLVAPGSVLAQEAEVPEKESILIVFGDDPCPQSSDEEIVVCARRPDSERYRIPKEVREKQRDPMQRSWASRVETLDEIARQNLPGGCSVVGMNGQSGCWQQMMRQWTAERRQIERLEEEDD